MKNLLVILVALFIMNARVKACPLEGYWKSNEVKTLASFRSVESATPKQKEIFENNFFGKLIVKIECDKFTIIYDNQVETQKYFLSSFSDKVVRMKYDSELEGEVIREATIEDNCYSLLIDMPKNNDHFKEYFCPINETEYNKALQRTSR